MVPTRRKNTARPRLGMHGRENAVRFTGGQFPENAERCEADDGSILNPESAAGEKGGKTWHFTDCGKWTHIREVATPNPPASDRRKTWIG